ncbi:hypothetical protein WB403_49220, partial [Streptomyces brasiliscabiei]
QLDPTNVGDVGATGCSLGTETCYDHSPAAINAFSAGAFYQPDPMFAGMTAAAAGYPSGSSKADLFQQTVYADGSTVAVEKFLVSNDGKILDFSNP